MKVLLFLKKTAVTTIEWVVVGTTCLALLLVWGMLVESNGPVSGTATLLFCLFGTGIGLLTGGRACFYTIAGLMIYLLAWPVSWSGMMFFSGLLTMTGFAAWIYGGYGSFIRETSSLVARIS